MRFLRPLRGKGGKGNPIWEKDDVMNTIWKPQPRQRDFMIRTEYEALYGGAAGGGKSEALVCEALRQVDKPFYRGLLIRKTFPQLEELVSKSLRYYKAAYPGAKYNGSQHKWTFPSGAQIYFGSMPNKNSYLNYQGLSYEYIGVDELTHFTQAEYEYLTSRNRANGEGARVYIRATANPGGIGHGWVKDRFVTVTKPNTTHTYTAEAIAPDGTKYNVERTRVFIPSSVFDNKILLANDPSYIGTLAMMPEAQKRALLYGEWDSFEGQVFTEFRNNSDGYLSGINTHVIEPFEIPRHWRRYREAHERCQGLHRQPCDHHPLSESRRCRAAAERDSGPSAGKGCGDSALPGSHQLLRHGQGTDPLLLIDFPLTFPAVLRTIDPRGKQTVARKGRKTLP